MAQEQSPEHPQNALQLMKALLDSVSKCSKISLNPDNIRKNSAGSLEYHFSGCGNCKCGSFFIRVMGGKRRFLGVALSSDGRMLRHSFATAT